MILQVVILLCFVCGKAISQNGLDSRINSLQITVNSIREEQVKQQQQHDAVSIMLTRLARQTDLLQKTVEGLKAEQVNQKQNILELDNLASKLQGQITELLDRQDQLDKPNAEPLTTPPTPTPTPIPPTPTPTPIPPIANGRYPHRVFHVNRRVHGVATSGSSATLICVNRKSTPSGIGDDARARVRCRAGELMTSCSGYTQDKTSFRDGEKYEFENGEVICAAYNAYGSTAPVFAQARCCRRTGLFCELADSGPLSFNGSSDGDRAETVCTSGRIATGCSAYSWYNNLDGALHRRDSCIAQMNGFTENLGAVYSYAFCCSASNLRCNIQTSTEGGRTKGSSVFTQCAPNQVMLGCSGFSEDGDVAGSKITDDPRPRCEAVSGANRPTSQRGVQASAVCCTA